MVVQCRICKKIRDNGFYRAPWPGELPLDVTQTYCPECAESMLKTIQRGETPIIYKPLVRQEAS